MVWLLLAAFQIKHFLCDFPLQTQYMLVGKGGVKGWVAPLAAHAIRHAVGTMLIAVVFLELARPEQLTGDESMLVIGLTVADFVLHFVVDRIKAAPTLGGRWKPNQDWFWWALGLDQLAHHVINIGFIYLLT